MSDTSNAPSTASGKALVADPENHLWSCKFSESHLHDEPCTCGLAARIHAIEDEAMQEAVHQLTDIVWASKEARELLDELRPAGKPAPIEGMKGWERDRQRRDYERHVLEARLQAIEQAAVTAFLESEAAVELLAEALRSLGYDIAAENAAVVIAGMTRE